MFFEQSIQNIELDSMTIVNYLKGKVEYNLLILEMDSPKFKI